MQIDKIDLSAGAKARTSSVTQQSLERLEITQLKNLRDVQLDFSGTCMTALMGANGNGKSTVLHALACAFEVIDWPRRE